MHTPELRLVFWETTAGCNLACQHCRRLEVSQALSQEDLTTQEAKRLIDGIAAAGHPVLVFSGGEPLLRPDLFDLAAYATEIGLPIALASNGTLINARMADRISEAGFDRVAVSIDGANAATHDAFRNQAGAFATTIEGLEHLRSRSVSRQINTTVTKHNVAQLDAMHQLVEVLGVDAWHLFMFVPVGCGLTVPAEQQLLAAQYEDTLNWIAERSMASRCFMRVTCAPQYFRILAQRQELALHRANSHLSAMTKGCLAGTGICFVSHKGEVFPCGYLPMVCGNVREEPFDAIWRASPIFSTLRDPSALEGKCGACEFRMICSGCRARAFAASGDYLAEEPCCPYRPAHARA